MPSKMEEEDKHELTDLTNARGGNEGHGDENENNKVFSTSLVFVFLTRKGNGNQCLNKLAAMEETWLGNGGIATIMPLLVTVHLCCPHCRCCCLCLCSSHCDAEDNDGTKFTTTPVMSTSCSAAAL
jgi:hypothetical protein